jgi:hypothetical protein
MESGLKWVTYVSDGWITVSPSSGIGNTSNVIISINDDWSDQDTLSGTVTFRCIECKSSESNEKIINVCRCACDCSDFSFEQLVRLVPQNGLTIDTIIGTYSVLTSRCSTEKISGYIIENNTVIQTLKFDDGNIKLNENIEHGDNELEVKIYFDEVRLCGEPWIIEQEHTNCTCDDIIVEQV